MVASPSPTHRFAQIPVMIQGYSQWIVWKYELVEGSDVPTKVPYNAKNGYRAKVTNPAHWTTFNDAVNACLKGGYDGIGFCFTDNDPFLFIDLDDASHDPVLMKMHNKIIETFTTYAERSPSGKGTHIIALATIEEGKRSKANAAEMYFSGRYATFTGDRLNEYDITEQQKYADMLYKQIENTRTAPKLVVDNTKSLFVDKPASRSDEDVIAACLSAKNGELFAALYSGDWQAIRRYQNSNGTGNQSLADQAIFNFLFFHSGNSEQMIRLFHMSQLGKRKKAFRHNYLWPMIENSADMQHPIVDSVLNIPDDYMALIAAQDAARAPEVLQAIPQAEPADSPASSEAPGDGHGSGQGQEYQAAPVEGNTAPGGIKSTPGFLLKPPPGLLGEVAGYIYGTSSRPVPHIALAAAIGFMAGICGRAFNCSKPAVGLNQYILLLAPTGRGKEAMKAGIKSIINSMVLTNPTAHNILGPGKINSGQAIRPYLEGNKCFVTVQGEFDATYSQMVQQNANSANKALKQELLDLYMASGVNGSAETSIYSDDKKNVAAIKSPAMTLLGECTIKSMNAILDEKQINDGLLTRFINIVYDGPRVDKNEHAGNPPPIEMVMKLCKLHAITQQNEGVNKVIHLEEDSEALRMLNAFDKYADAQINDKSREQYQELWNRAHLKALKLAALLCASDYAQSWSAHITAEQAQWAIDLVKHDIQNIIQRFEKHETGDQANEAAQMRDTKKYIAKIARELPSLTEAQMKSFAIPATFRMHRIIPASYLQMVTRNVASFRTDKRGPRKALFDSLKELEDAAVIYDISRDPQCQEKYGTRAKGFALLKPDYFAGL